MFFIISLEIHNPTVRSKILKTLDGFGSKVQKNLYEFHLDKVQSAKFFSQIMDLSQFLSDKDQIRIYQVCQKCKKQSLFLGSAKITIEPLYYLV
jgi:CRISPR-associated endonuclease Cas2